MGLEIALYKNQPKNTDHYNFSNSVSGSELEAAKDTYRKFDFLPQGPGARKQPRKKRPRLHQQQRKTKDTEWKNKNSDRRNDSPHMCIQETKGTQIHPLAIRTFQTANM